MKNINKIIEHHDLNQAMACLKEAKRLAKKGLVIELMDLLVPEDARTVTVMDGKRRRIIRR